MNISLTFNDITFSPVPHQNSLWIRAVELARALGYSSEEKVSRVYRRNADEFTADMTQVIEISAEAQNGLLGSAGRCRIFSLRGCHLLAMFARTPVAKAFRKWVLDVLDRLAAEERAALPSSDTLTPEQQAHLQAIVAAKAGMVPASHRRRAFQEIWARFNNNFQIARYAQLPPARIGEAVEYLVSMEVKAAKALPPTDKESLAVATSTALAFRADFPDDMGSDRREAMQRMERIAREMHTSFTVVRNIVRLGCHPGSKTMRMSLDEREAYETLHNLYTTADESLCAAYNALDAGYKLGRLYGRG